MGDVGFDPALRVTLVITCYNQAHFLAEAIESVLAQDYPCLEVLVVDDGSTDATPTIARQYAAVRYLGQSNRGLSAARNAGLQESRGEWVGFLDADDRLLPGAVGTHVRCIQAHPDAAFVFGAYVRVDEDGRFLDQPSLADIEADPYGSLLQGNVIGMHGAVLYRRSVLADEGGFDEALHVCEDYDVYLRLARHHHVACHSDRVAEYRIRSSSMSGNAGEMLSGVLRILHAQRKYIQGDAARTHAYHAGHRYWREFYAQKFVTQEALSSDRQGKSRLWSGRLRILRQAPVEFIRAWTSRYRAHPPVPRLVSILAARVRGRAYVPATGRVHFGDLRRTTPLSPWFGFDRGLPIDRYYIQRFLAVHWKAIRGRTMEVGDDGYTQMYGRDRVARCDVLHVSEGNPRATIVADLSNAPMIPSNTYDCIVLTQTLHLIYDVQAALQTLFRILKPGGVLLATVPGVSQISNDQWGQSWYWGFTQLSLRRLLEEHFPAAHVTVEAHGNVLAGLGFLEGMAAGDFTVAELDFRDPQYEVLITALASKPRGAG